jgi:hypothetical protein
MLSLPADLQLVQPLQVRDLWRDVEDPTAVEHPTGKIR